MTFHFSWLWVDNQNHSTKLVEEGLASVHFSAERSVHFRALQMAEESAKAKKLRIWKNFVEKEVKAQPEEDIAPERKTNYQSVVVTEVTPELHFYVQKVENGAALEQLMAQLRQDLAANPPLAGSFSPKKGNIAHFVHRVHNIYVDRIGDLCAAKFTDGEWYRARVEKVTGNQVRKEQSKFKVKASRSFI